MTTLDLPIRTTARMTANACLVLLSGLRTFSGLVVVLGAVLFVAFDDSGAGGAPTSETEDDSRFPASDIDDKTAVKSHLMFFLVESQTQADLVAAEEYQIWAHDQIAVGSMDRHIRVLFARTPVEEAAAHNSIVQEIGAVLTPSVVTILDRRNSD